MYFKIFLLLFFIIFSGTQSLFAQNREDFNGRNPEQLAAQKKVVPPINTAKARGGNDESPGQGEDKDEGTYPLPAADSFSEHGNLEEINTKIKELLTQIEKLQLTDTELQTELDNIKKGLEMCCGGSVSLEEHDKAAHLLQNAPNPFIDHTNIQYFIPENSGTSFLEIRSLEGTILQSHPILQEGIGSIRIEDTALLSGGYLYTLSIDGQVLDSKIMIIAK